MAYSLRSRLAVVVLLAAIAAAALSACATCINKVLADPSRYRNEEVTVSGTVVDSFSIGTPRRLSARRPRGRDSGSCPTEACPEKARG